MPETPAAPARFARRTKDWSNETKTAPGGRPLKCIASASSIPWTVSARAAATDGSSSVCTFWRPSNLVNASRTALSSNPYILRWTQPVSSNTVFAIQIGSFATGPCGGLFEVVLGQQTYQDVSIDRGHGVESPRV